MLETLEALGLSQAEAQVYVALLKLGETTTGDIIKETDLQSSTVYHVLSTLEEKGLAGHVKKGKTKHFTAADPERFHTLLAKKQHAFDEILPELNDLATQGRTETAAEVYKDYKGLQTAFDDILHTLDEGDTYRFFQIRKDELEEERTQLFFRNYHLKRAEAGINVQGLSTHDTKEEMETIFDDIPHTELRYVDTYIPHSTIIYDNKVIILDLEDTPTAFVVQSSNIAGSHKQFFTAKWED